MTHTTISRHVILDAPVRLPLSVGALAVDEIRETVTTMLRSGRITYYVSAQGRYIRVNGQLGRRRRSTTAFTPAQLAVVEHLLVGAHGMAAVLEDVTPSTAAPQGGAQ